MGYTRYWTRTNAPFTEDFLAEVRKVLENCKTYGITIRNSLGEGDPVITPVYIALNGDAGCHLDYESFVLDGRQGFGFCKTARRPYDYAVREILKLAADYDIVEAVSDDGENEEIISDLDYLLK